MKDLYETMERRHLAFQRGVPVSTARLDHNEEFYTGDDAHSEGSGEWERKYWVESEATPAHELPLSPLLWI